MKLILTMPTFMLLLASGALARNCTPNLSYCGSTLKNIGKYQAQIDQALADAGKPEAEGGADDLFSCVGGANGVIKYTKYCDNGCHDGGSGHNDYCN